MSIASSSSTYTVPASGTQNITFSIAKSGKTPIAIAGYNGLTGNLYVRQFVISGDTITFYTHNLAASAQTGTINVWVLYK